MKPTTLVLKRDGMKMASGTYIEIMEWVHRNHCYSLDHALKYEGYSIEEPPAKRSARGVPPCARVMGCLCAGHARGNSASFPCDTRETA